MRILSRYVFREILTSSVLGTLLATFVLFLHGADAPLSLLIGSNPGPRVVVKLLLLALPGALPFTIPFGVLIGILIGLGRMSADGEIIAMRAAGVPSRKVLMPVLLFAALGMGLAAWATLRLTPYAMNESARIITQLAASQVTANIQPGVFNEDFPNTILYVDEVRPGPPGSGRAEWRKVVIFDVTPEAERKKGFAEQADGPLVTVAEKAIAVSDPKNSRIDLELRNYATHEMGKDKHLSNDFTAPVEKTSLQGKPPQSPAEKPRAMSTRRLLQYQGPDKIEASVELGQRFALPVACVMLALVGIPLGVATRKGGKSAAYVMGVFLGFFCYYLSTVSLVNMAKQQSLSPAVATWLPDVMFGLAGIVFLIRLERPGDRDLLGGIAALWNRVAGRFQGNGAGTREPGRLSGWRIPMLPQIVDTYVLGTFLFYLTVVLASLVSMILVYNFFELTGDMIKHNITLRKMFTYLFFLSPQLIYETMPICVVVAVLVSLGVLSKNNEVTAFKACGVSVYRLGLPILLVCTALSGGLFAFDHYYVPDASRTQDRLRDEIKGKPVQTYIRPDRKWTMGHDLHIYYYRYFDPAETVMLDVNVFELQKNSFQLLRQVRAAKAMWNPTRKTWTYKDGWVSDFRSQTDKDKREFDETLFRELNETPDYFLKENLLDTQMNFQQLERYIDELHKGGYGYDTAKLQVQLYRKFSVPVFAVIMAMLAIPFGFFVGNRGAMTGIGVSIAISLSYLGTSLLFSKVGELNQLPPAMAAWAPDVVFGLVGVYLLLRIRS